MRKKEEMKKRKIAVPAVLSRSSSSSSCSLTTGLRYIMKVIGCIFLVKFIEATHMYIVRDYILWWEEIAL
jgi:hypothetical protein